VLPLGNNRAIRSWTSTADWWSNAPDNETTATSSTNRLLNFISVSPFCRLAGTVSVRRDERCPHGQTVRGFGSVTVIARASNTSCGFPSISTSCRRTRPVGQ